MRRQPFRIHGTFAEIGIDGEYPTWNAVRFWKKWLLCEGVTRKSRKPASTITRAPESHSTGTPSQGSGFRPRVDETLVKCSASVPKKLLDLVEFLVRQIKILLGIDGVMSLQGGITLRQIHLHAFLCRGDIGTQVITGSDLLLAQGVNTLGSGRRAN